MSERVYVIAFESTHAAMAAHRALEHIKPAMIPTPKAISAGCGMSLRFRAEDDAAALALAEGVEAIRGLASLFAEEDGAYCLIKAV